MSVNCLSSVVRFLFVGPVMHNFYRFLERVVPKDASRVFLKRLLIDRFLYTPFFLIVYLYSVAILEVMHFPPFILVVFKFLINMRVYNHFRIFLSVGNVVMASDVTMKTFGGLKFRGDFALNLFVYSYSSRFL